MGLFDLFKEKVSSYAKDEMVMFVLEYEHKHFEFYPQNSVIKYRNVISSPRGGDKFPDRFFDEKKYILSNNELYKCESLISDLLKKTALAFDLEFLPPGAEREEYSRIEFSSGETRYYTNTVLSSSGFSVQRLPSNSYFLSIFNFMNDLCVFPQENDLLEISNNINDVNFNNDKYYNETLWVCKNCNEFNLFQHKKCVKCGADRNF